MNPPLVNAASVRELVRRGWLPALAVAVMVALGAWLLGAFGHAAPGSAGKPTERRVRFYQDSMHPWIKSAQPGKCTVCGMDLTAIYEDQNANGLAADPVALSPSAITVLNVQTEEVRRQPLTRAIRVAGTLEVNQTSKRVVAAPAPGRIDELMVDYAGVEVREGQPLVTFYSPALTQDKLRFLVRTRHSGPQRDPTGNLAKEIDSDPYYNDLLAPQSGTVLERNVTKGQYVAEGEKLFTIADASVVWFRFDVYEQQLPWVHPGQKIQVTVPALPGTTYTATISFLEPMLNEATRTVKVRADLPNPLVESQGRKERLLRFGMYAEGVLQAATPEVVLVSHAAILYPGHAAYVYVDKGEGVYERRQVRLGRKGNKSWEVLEGLHEGDRVVVSGNVLLDAQAHFNEGGADQAEDAVAMDSSADASESAPTEVAASARMPAPGPEAASTEQATPKPTPAKSGMVRASMDNPPSHARSSVVSASAASPMSMLMADPGVQTVGGTAVTNAMTLPVQGSSPPRPNVKARVPTANTSDRGLFGNNMFHAQIMNRWRDRHIGELLENPVPLTNASIRLSPTQSQSLLAFLATANSMSQALAADDLGRFNRQVATLSNHVVRLQKEFVLGDRWRGQVQNFLASAHWPPANDLAQARAQFQSFAINAVELARELKKQEPAFAGIKIYHCPMALPPGLWLQTEGPLANPFYGAKMLRCGEEWTGDKGELTLNQKQPAASRLEP